MSKAAGDLPPFELEPGVEDFKPVLDNRFRMPEPLPVRLVAVEDIRLPSPTGIEEKLDAFYVELLQFERLRDPGEPIAFRADNFILRFDVADRPVVHESLRPTQIEVPSLQEAEKKLLELELEYTRQRGMTPGEESLLMIDPAGNWIELQEYRVIR
jgi:hypothetical protein